MLIIRKNWSLKKYLLLVLFVFSVFAIEVVTSTGDTENTTYALFLGCGVKHEKGPCNDFGYRIIEHSVRVFGLQVGDSWTTEVAC